MSKALIVIGIIMMLSSFIAGALVAKSGLLFSDDQWTDATGPRKTYNDAGCVWAFLWFGGMALVFIGGELGVE